MSSFDFQVENSDRTVQYKLNAQSLRLFGLHSDVNDAHRAGANRLQNRLHRIVPAPAIIAGRGEMVRLRSGRFDWTVQVGYPPRPRSATSPTGESHPHDTGIPSTNFAEAKQ